MSDITIDSIDEHEDGSVTITLTLSYGALVDYAMDGLMAALERGAADVRDEEDGE